MSERKFLIVGPAWVGDMVMAHSLVQTLLSQHADAIIDIIAPTWSMPLVERMPGVRRAIELPLGHGQFAWPTRRRIGKSLQQHCYTDAIIIPRSFKAALVPFHAAIANRTGYLGESRYGLLNDVRTLDKNRLDGTAKRYVALGRAKNDMAPVIVPPPRLQIDTTALHDTLKRLDLSFDARRVALMPGAEYGPAKQWPVEHFAALAQQLIKGGQQVVVVGSKKERELGHAIVNDIGKNAINLCGQTQLTEAIDVLSSCHAVVSNDSGLMHVAAAVGAKVFALYGSSSPTFTPPLTDNAHIFYQQLHCSPCFKRTCPLGTTQCLVDITPASVADQVLIQ